MHIAYITSEFVTEKWRGGLATYLDNITNIMSKHGHNVTVITLSEQDGRLRYGNNVEVVRIMAKEIPSVDEEIRYALALMHNSWRLYNALRQEDKKNRIDIVQTANYQAVGFFRLWSIPTVVRASSDASLWRNAMKYEFDYKSAVREKKLADYLELHCEKRADAVFAPSRFCADVIKKRSGQDVTIIESPYLWENQEMDESLYQEKLLGKKYLLFNSTLSRLKGTHVGIEAAEKILEKYGDLYMVYVGYDYGLSQKEGNSQKVAGILMRQGKKYGGRVVYLGHVEHKKLFPIVKNALACVLPSRVDNLPNSCIEAMALGSIVIGTYGASFEQLIHNKENGLLIKRDSPTALIKAVDCLMNLTEEERMKMGEYATDTVNRLKPDKIYHELVSFYGKTIEKFK